MRTVEIVPGIKSSVLGFGCAPILGSQSNSASKRALDLALAHGINHFDLARSYGFGEAEEFVGSVIKHKRRELVLASKFGITPNWKAGLLKSAKPLLRWVKKAKPSPTNTASPAHNQNKSSISNLFLDRVSPLSGKFMRTSLHKTLKKLRTDYLDFFLVHEPLQSLSSLDELAETAQRLKEEGKIRAFGLSYMQTQKALHQHYLDQFDFLQFDNPPGEKAYEELVTTNGHSANIIFSPIRGGASNLSPEEKLRSLFSDFSNSVILCSMFSERNLKQNVSIASQSPNERYQHSSTEHAALNF